jgi:hypothetical protein
VLILTNWVYFPHPNVAEGQTEWPGNAFFVWGCGGSHMFAFYNFQRARIFHDFQRARMPCISYL